MVTVVFGYGPDFSRVVSVYWQDDEGVKGKHIRNNGEVFEKSYRYSSLRQCIDDVSGTYSPVRPAQVEDLRSAFKYLGKSSELADMLPEAQIEGEPQGYVDLE